MKIQLIKCQVKKKKYIYIKYLHTIQLIRCKTSYQEARDAKTDLKDIIYMLKVGLTC